MKSTTWLKYTSPSSVGTITAAMLALYPAGSERVKWTETLALKLVYISSGFLVSYFSVKILNWSRKNLLFQLFSYTGWMVKPKAIKTKVFTSLSIFLTYQYYLNLKSINNLKFFLILRFGQC